MEGLQQAVDMLRGLTADNGFNFYATGVPTSANVPRNSIAVSLDHTEAQQRDEEAARQDALLDAEMDEMAAEMMD